MKWILRSQSRFLLYAGTLLPFFMHAAEQTKTMETASEEFPAIEVTGKKSPEPSPIKVVTEHTKDILPAKIVIEPSKPITVKPSVSHIPSIPVTPSVPTVSTVPPTPSVVPTPPNSLAPSAPVEPTTSTPSGQVQATPAAPQVPVAGNPVEPTEEKTPEKEPQPVVHPSVHPSVKPEVKTVEKKEPLPLEEKKETIKPKTVAPTVEEEVAHPVEEQPKEIQSVPEKPSQMLDTIDIEEGGNWLIKRQIFEDTFRLIDEMDQVNTKIRDMRMTFFQLRNDIDKEIALFIKDIGYNLGKLDQMATTMLSHMDQEKKEEGDLSQEGRSVVLSLGDLEKKIKVIQNAVQEILNLENKIDSEILKSLEDRINESSGYRQQGWKNLQAIKKMLNDEKAQNLYNKTKALYDTLKDVLSWLQSKLLPYFRQTIQTIKNDMNTLRSHLQELQKEGFDLQKEINTFEKKEQVDQEEHIQNEIKDAVEKAELETKAALQKQSFFSRLKVILWYPIQLFQDGITWIANFFSSSQKSESE